MIFSTALKIPSLALLAFATLTPPAAASMWNTYRGAWNDPESWVDDDIATAGGSAWNGVGIMEISEGGAAARYVYLGVVNGDSVQAPGTGSIEITNGGTLQVGEILHIASTSSAYTDPQDQRGNVLVSGNDSGLSSEFIGIGLSGHGTLTVRQGAFVGASTLGAGGLYIGEVDLVKTAFRGQATIDVTGEGTILDLSDRLELGVTGDATLDISDGAKVYARELWIGTNHLVVPGVSERGDGEIKITGVGSELILSGPQTQLNVGMAGDAKLTIEEGGTFTSVGSGTLIATIGRNTGGRGSVTISGSGSQWLHSGDLNFGDGGRADVVIENGGLLSTTGRFGYASGAFYSAQGSLLIQGAPPWEAPNAGVLETFYLEGSSIQTATFDHGIIRAVANQSNLIRGFTSLSIREGGLIIDTQSYLVGLARQLAGAGGLTKTGDGTLTISTAQAYTGPTVVEEGTLLLGVSDATGTGEITMKDGTALGKSITTPIYHEASTVIAEGDVTFLSPGGIFAVGSMDFLAEEATLTLAPGLVGQVADIQFSVTGKITTEGSLSVVRGDEEINTKLFLSGANEFGGEFSIGEGILLELTRFAGGTVNHDFRIDAGATTVIRYSEQISDTHTTRVNGRLEFGWPNDLVETLGTLEGSGTIQAYNATSGTWNQTLQVHQGIFAGQLRDGSSFSKLHLTKLGDETLVLLNSNAYSGRTTVKRGTLLAGNNNAFGQGALHLEHGVTIGKSVITDISLGNAMTHIEGDVTISSPGGSIYFQSVGVASGSHILTLAPASSGQTAGTSTYIERSLGGTGDLYLRAGGDLEARLILQGNLWHNTHTGLMTVGRNVTLELQKSGTTAIAGDLNIEEGGTVIIGKSEQINNQSRVSVEGRLAFGADREIIETIDYLNVSFNGVVQGYNAYGMEGEWKQTLRVNEGVSYGTIADGSDNSVLSLEKLGSGHLFIGGNGNHYSGDTHIREGSMTIHTLAGSATGTGDVYVHEGATLFGGSGIAGSLFVDGELVPGNSPGVLHVGGDVVFSETADLYMEIWFGDIAGVTYDQLKVDGDLVFGGTLWLLFDPGYEFSGPLQLFDVAGISSGVFDDVKIVGLSEDVAITIDYMNGTIAIPEPGTMSLLGVGALGYLLLRRRQRQAA